MDVSTIMPYDSDSDVNCDRAITPTDIKTNIDRAEMLLMNLAGMKNLLARWVTIIQVIYHLLRGMDQMPFANRCAGCKPHVPCRGAHSAFQNVGDLVETARLIRAAASAFDNQPNPDTFMVLRHLLDETDRNILGIETDLETAEGLLDPCTHWLHGNCLRGNMCNFGHLVGLQGSETRFQTKTCEFWLRGRCRNSAETCKFAHSHL